MSGRTITGIVILVVVVVSAVVAAILPATLDAPEPGESVAVVPLAGQIREAPAGFAAAGGIITPAIVRERLAEAAADPNVGAVVMRIDSPGGSVAASQEIAALFDEHADPVVVSMGDQAASGGYYIATGADQIVAHPGTITGSIGVIFQLFDVSELLDNWGVEIETITQGELKDALSIEGVDEEGRQMVEGLTEDFYDQFVAAVADSRDLSKDEATELATGAIFSGAEAAELGLVDELGGVNEAVDVAAGLAGIEDPQVIELRPGFFDQFFGGGQIALPFSRTGYELDAEGLLLWEALRGARTPQYRVPLGIEAEVSS